MIYVRQIFCLDFYLFIEFAIKSLNDLLAV